MKKLVLVIFFQLTIFLSMSALAADVNIIYVNGIQNTLAAARDSRQSIANILSTSKIHTGSDLRHFSVTLVWNPIGWNGTEEGCDLCQDKEELFLLKTAEELFSDDFQKIVIPYNQSKYISKDAAVRVKAYLDDMTPGNNSLESNKKINDADMVMTQDAIQGIVTETKRLGSAVIVAHSQGNLLANLAWASYASELGADVAGKMIIINVANTSLFSVNSLNLTHGRDAALFSAATDKFDIDVSLETLPSQGKNWNRTTPSCNNSACNFILAPPTFAGVDNTGGLLDHAFVDTYLSSVNLPTILVDNGIKFSSDFTAFRDRFEDLVYTAAFSLETRSVSYSISPKIVEISKDIIFTITGSNLVAGMGFAVDDCTPSSNELPGGTSTQRQYRCTINGVPGQKNGVLKIKPGIQESLFNFNVTAIAQQSSKWISTITPPNYVVKQFIFIDLAALSNGPFNADGEYRINFDKIGCNLTQKLAVSGNRNGNDFTFVMKYVSPQTRCSDGSHTADINYSETYSGVLNSGILFVTPQTSCSFQLDKCYNFESFSPTQ